ncbi:MAG: hypothetical protein HYZ29_08650 [Myxococcales bacterium]|nr:hypothetical protein [Myxococcales bacterium]
MSRAKTLSHPVALAAGLLLTLPGCSCREQPLAPVPSSSASTSSLAPPPASSALPAASSGNAAAHVRIEPTSSRARVFLLPFRAVDVVAGAAPSSEFPRGTLVFAKSGDGEFSLVEWDPSRGHPVREATHRFEPGDRLQVGNTHALSRTGAGFAYATTGYEDPSPIELWLLGQDFSKKHHVVIDAPTVADARRLALHGSGETLALSYCAASTHHVVTFDAPSGKVIGRTKLGRKLALCVGFATPLADVRVVGSKVWTVSGELSDFQAVALGRDLRRVVARYPVPTPGLDRDARKSAVDRGDFPRFDATTTRIAWNTRGELRMSDAERGTSTWKARVDPASLPTGLVSVPEENDFPIAIDPETGAALLGDGTWYAPDGTAQRVFHVREEQPEPAPTPVQHLRRAIFAHGRAVVLAVSPERATLVLVEPQRAALDGGP